MQDDPLSFDQGLDALLDEALRQPSAVAVPLNFSQRILAALPPAPAPAHKSWDLWPAAAVCLLPLAGAALWWNGALGLLVHPALLVAAGALEMTFAVLWALRADESAL